ncbi:MAG TPA: protein-L-isoaspartate(D-aspartate) O-methyltransferase [Nodosilinea sp.]|nr:protein-L-isoaspartate(D-aspartate) O-methyltransferase [Nodosilinea sp.]
MTKAKSVSYSQPTSGNGDRPFEPTASHHFPDRGSHLERFYAEQRHRMVNEQLKPRGITDPRIINALLTVPRHRFVSTEDVYLAYQDQPLPISHHQTISQPYIVAFMADAAAIPINGKVLEIGTGSGYQAAVLAQLANQVYTVEIVAPLAHQAQQTLGELGYTNVHIRHGNGHFGWADHAPYDAIVVSAAANHVPPALVDQLALGGKLVIPVGHSSQTVLVITKHLTGTTTEYTIPVQFVPMTGEGA